jgi:hypothetical protein
MNMFCRASLLSRLILWEFGGWRAAMSVDTFVFLRDDRLPPIAVWQAALDQAAVGIVLSDVSDLRKHTGYLPARHRGHPSGFEWYFGTIAEYFGGELPSGLGDRGHVINFVTHSDTRELFCAMVSGAVLASIADGRLFDEESGGLLEPDTALAQALTLERFI